MSFGIIYKATNKVNGKVYIGQTTQRLSQRRSNHFCSNSGCVYFKNALLKYGKSNFTWLVLCECGDGDIMDEEEIRYINEYKSYDRKYGYNLNRGGSGNMGFKHTENTKNKISSAKTGVKLPKFTATHKKRIGLSNKGKRHSEESKLKMSAARMGRYRGSSNWLSKKYVVSFPNNKEYVVVGLRNFCRDRDDVSYKGLAAVATGKRNHHKGYKCRYFDEDKDKNIRFWRDGD
jgi:group I intron endonuclease